jgi:hypothetical protein
MGSTAGTVGFQALARRHVIPPEDSPLWKFSYNALRGVTLARLLPSTAADRA